MTNHQKESEISYLGIGLAIGFIIAVVIFIGMIFLAPKNSSALTINPAPTFTSVAFTNTPFISTTITLSPGPTSTYTPTPTYQLLRTMTPSVTGTLKVADQMINSGGLLFTGPLTNDQQRKLYEVSLRYIASSPEESSRLSKRITSVGEINASSICGPLAIAILRDAGLVPFNANPFDFWLLNPDVRASRKLLDKTFPPESYTDTRYKVKLHKFDWKANPLQPGDFIYIYAGTGGNFEHMLVVDRVDSLGRAYSVTNHKTQDGYVINEVMLYDPIDPSIGIFHQWTERQYNPMGSTGYAGFELWRHR